MKAKELKDLSIEDLQSKLAEEKANYDKLKLTHKVSQVENPIGIRQLRKNIARLSTVLNEKQA